MNERNVKDLLIRVCCFFGTNTANYIAMTAYVNRIRIFLSHAFCKFTILLLLFCSSLSLVLCIFNYFLRFLAHLCHHKNVCNKSQICDFSWDASDQFALLTTPELEWKWYFTHSFVRRCSLIQRQAVRVLKRREKCSPNEFHQTKNLLFIVCNWWVCSIVVNNCVRNLVTNRTMFSLFICSF